MAEESTIMLERKIIHKLKEAKEYPRQTYNELINKMTSLFIAIKRQKEGNYDRFLFEIQKNKMKELWDNKYDEIWEKA